MSREIGSGENKGQGDRIRMMRSISSRPPVWAETRQELAESLSYYRAYQSGCYFKGPYVQSTELISRARNHGSSETATKDVTPYAYLLGGFGSPRDAWLHQGKMIISHGGGHASAVEVEEESLSAPTPDAPSKGPLQGHELVSSQCRSDVRIAGLLSAHRSGDPIILIMAENYTLAHFQLNCGFAVLGWYSITDAWAEREQGETVRWKFKFEWLSRQGPPWWLDCSSEVAGQPEWNPRERTECSKLATKPPIAAIHNDNGSLGRKDKRTARLIKRLRKRSSGGSLSSTLGLSRICERAGTRSLAVRKRCEFCTQTSPTVYRRGWTCLTPECEKGFWQFNSSTPASVDSCDAFDFEPSFVARRSEAAHLGCEQTDSAGPSTTIPFSIEPTSSVGKIRPSDGLRGIFCDQCHRVSCREFLAFHRCSHCGLTRFDGSVSRSGKHAGKSSHHLVQTPTSESSLVNDPTLSSIMELKPSVRFEHDTDNNGDSIRFAITTFTFPPAFLGAKVHIIKPDPCFIDGKGHRHRHRDPASDAIADELQATVPRAGELTADVVVPSVPLEDRPELWIHTPKLRRHALTSHRSAAGAEGKRSRLLTQMFTANVGATYKHSTETETTSWAEASPCLLKAGEILEKRTRWVLESETDNLSHIQGGPEALFNELYPCYYLEGMKMNFHDDGEPGLGPIVSSLSLGSVSATMDFRVKKKFVTPDDSATDTFADDMLKSTATAGSGDAHIRRTRATSRQVYAQLQRSLVASCLKVDKSSNSARSSNKPLLTDRNVLSIPLTHGCVVVQEGRVLQEVLEHRVSPHWDDHRGSGGSRLAVTARWIGEQA